tara:strand:+ start:2295 stop:2759 length:465 start_codon:yes stop_codon:yes gene_type:complete
MKSSTIPNYDNYTIYENGDVYSKIRRGGGGKLKQHLNVNGYYCFNLTKDSITKHCTIHRLLAICFIPNPENKPCVDHIDRDRTNNDLSNLRWVTYEENNNNKEKSKGCIHINKCYYNDKVYEYIRFSWREDGKTKSKNFKSLEDAENYRLNLFL